MNEIVSSNLKELRVQNEKVQCQFVVPLSANFKQDVVQGKGEINMEPVFQEFTVKQERGCKKEKKAENDKYHQ